jgi:hypothetical protein
MAVSFDEALYEVLQQPRYDRLAGRALDIRGMIADAVTRVIEFIIDRINIPLPNALGINPRAAAVFFMALGAAAAVTAAFCIIRRMKRNRKGMGHDVSGIMEEIIKRNLTAAQWLELSNRHSLAGETREAVRYRYIAVLAALHDKRVIRIQASKTNKQIMTALLAAKPALASPFAAAVDCFHRVWFGYKEIDEQGFTGFSETVDCIIKS